MTRFSSPRSYDRFRREVRERARFVRSRSANQFLNAVAGTIDLRAVTLSKDDGPLFRAQKHFEWFQVDNDATHAYPVPATAERMKPQKGRAPDGRANPRGIPFLYLSNDPETAMSEVRPWIGSLVTVADMRLVRDVRLVDCHRFHKKGTAGGYLHWLACELAWNEIRKPTPEEIEEIVWADIDNAFSTPTEAKDDTSDYIPTQILAELFKSKGFDGIIYKSRLRKDGYNFAMFDLDIADIVKRKLYHVNKLNYSFEEEGPP
jgi:hypothetical protein